MESGIDLAAMRALVVLCSESGTHEITNSTGERERELEMRLIGRMSGICH
jgi:hypothetical protein